MSEVLFYQILLSAVELAAFMYVVDGGVAASPTNIAAVIGALTVFLPTLLFCKLSETVTVHLEAIGDTFYACSWYCLSARQQKLFMLPIERAHKVFRMQGMGIVDCSLAIFSSASVFDCNDESGFCFGHF